MGLVSEVKIYSIEELLRIVKKPKLITTNKRIQYYNIACSFDIETTSFYEFNKLNNSYEKRAIMYEWTLCIDGYCTIGRTWEEFLTAYRKIVNWFDTFDKRKLIIYVHNLSFEFQFMRDYLSWGKIFALEKRKPVKCETTDGIEFRCSLLLSGYSLAKLSEQLTKYKAKKMVGDLDYSKIRHSKTPLTEKELGYCINDCMVVVNYIKELIERNDNDITKIPLTKTGFVREYCRRQCFYTENRKKSGNKFLRYRNLIKKLTVDVELYDQLKRGFAGGFTHASSVYHGKVIDNVSSIDFTSSYPYVMVSEKFPMSTFEEVEIKSVKDLKFNLLNFCCIFDIRFDNLRPKLFHENYLSSSHCWDIKNPVINNGRIFSADTLCTTLTEQDFMIINKFYTWDNAKIFNFKRAYKDYLPTDLVKSILKLYADKTELKGVEGKEIEYMQSKEYINSVYGMTVTDICRDEILYEEEWLAEKPDKEEVISKYNKSVKRFLFYAWGIWVTAYARKNLFTGIVEFDSDYIYSDTDSIKAINIENHLEYIENYNKLVRYKLEKACEYHKINVNLTRPKTIQGKVKELGVWDNDGKYDKFKTLGAKRYLVQKGDEFIMTVSGLNKKNAVGYMLQKFGKEHMFEMFSNDLYIPKTYTKDGIEISATGKMTHTYIDEPQQGYVTDYLGNTCEYSQLNGVHLENADYSLSLSEHYVDFLLNITNRLGNYGYKT